MRFIHKYMYVAKLFVLWRVHMTHLPTCHMADICQGIGTDFAQDGV